MQLNVNYSISALKYRFTREKKKLWEPVLIGVAIMISFLPLLAMYTGLMMTVFAGGALIGQPEMVLVVAFVFAQFTILIFGIFYIMGTFYFSKDLETFVPMPLKPYEIIGGKFAVVMVNEYLTSLPILLPPVIIFGIGTAVLDQKHHPNGSGTCNTVGRCCDPGRAGHESGQYWTI